MTHVRSSRMRGPPNPEGATVCSRLQLTVSPPAWKKSSLDTRLLPRKLFLKLPRRISVRTQRYNDYQRRIDWCADLIVRRVAFAAELFQSDSITFYSQEKLKESARVGFLPAHQQRHNLTVSWNRDGAAEPSRGNLRTFCAIRKQKVAQGLYVCSVASHTVNEELLQSWPEEFIPSWRMPYRQSLGYVSDNRDHEEYATDREGMVQGDSYEVFETDLDRLPRDANPGTVVTRAFLQDPEREGSNDSWTPPTTKPQIRT
ncbi:hypothetical protein V8E54_003493 [Elaphomyces granulatus]